LPEDADNVFVVLTARELNPKLKIISRASNDTSVKKLKRAGADNIIMPDKIGGAHMATLVLSPDVKEFIDVLSTTNTHDFQLAEITVSKSMLIEEIDSWNKTGATILSVKSVTGEYTLNPPSHYQVKPNERIIAMGSQKQLSYLKNLVGNE
jgi:voltage-gated potassium channel